MKVLLYVFLALIFLSALFTYPVLAIGLALAGWGFYEWRVNKKLNAKSKKPLAILIIGVILTIISANIYDDTSKETAKESTLNTSLKSETKDNEVTEEEKKINKNLEEQNEETQEKNEKKDEGSEKVSNIEQTKVEDETQTKDNLIQELGLVTATVSRVVDGDTFELSDGRKVRLIGVNTPESTTRTEPYGKEASNYTKSKLEGKQVYLQKDVSETDRYGRLLRLVWLDVPIDLMDENEIRKKMFNADLVLNGYAEPSTYPPDVTYAEYFRKFAREAREKEIGLWAYGEDGTTKGDFDAVETTSSNNNSENSSSSSNSSNSDSSNNSSSGSSTTSSSGEKESFKNCTELRKVYPNGVPADHPAYAPKHDRDKDGWACER